MTNPTFFTVVADFKSVVVDLASDVDADPTLGPVTAKVTFTPILANGDVILATDASPRPTGYVAAPIVARIDADGRLKLRVEPDGDRDDFASTEDFPATGNTAKVYFAIDEQTFYRWTGSAYAETYPYAAVRLLADTALLELASDLYYRVSFSEVVFNGGPGYIAPFTFQAPSTDVELNLIEVMRQPGQPASGITKIAPGAVRLEDGEVVFSFAGVDIPDPIAFEPSFTTAEITDAGTVGVDVLTAVDASAARSAINADFMVNAKDFGVAGNGTTDDTEALQDWLDYVTANKRQGWLPNGTYKITSTLVAPGSTYGWGIHGENENYTVIRQHTSNVPVLQIGSAAGYVHTITVTGLLLTYNSAQPSTNTNAICLKFSAPATESTVYWSTFRNMQFWNGYYAMQTASGTRPPWACRFDMLTCYAQTGGFLDDSLAYEGGGDSPNNVWGRATISCSTSIGPIFKSWRAYNTTVEAIEFLNASLGPKLITTAAGFNADIGSIKLEVGSYTGAGTNLFEFSANGYTRIGSIIVSVTDAIPTSGQLSIVSAVDTPGSKNFALHIGGINARATGTLSGTCVALSGGGARYVVGSADLNHGWKLTNAAETSTANNTIVSAWANGRLSTNQGDANYSVTLGDPNVVQFKTAFTAQRTITLPDVTDNNLFAGLYYDLIFDGAINGANTAVIKERTNTLRTQSVDKVRLRYQWRRDATAAREWVLVDIADLSGSTYLALGNSSSSILSQSLRANRNISGGGTITVSAGGSISWSQRFLVVAAGKGSAFATAGGFEVTCPTSGTITGVGGASNKTATADGIPLVTNDFEALYYILPLGSGVSSVAANFRVVGYSTDLEIPHNWVLICVRNNDNGTYNFPNGVTLRAGELLNTRVQDTANTANTVVRRDASGNFAAGTITTAGSIELGNASDTTLARTSAGQIAVEGNPVGIKVAVPATATSTGVVGQWAADASWHYVCTATNTWVRSAHATW